MTQDKILQGKRLQGKVWKYGDNVDTDAIIPARYLNMSLPEELAEHCMEDIDASFATNVEAGDIIVGGDNFGCPLGTCIGHYRYATGVAAAHARRT